MAGSVLRFYKGAGCFCLHTVIIDNLCSLNIIYLILLEMLFG